MTNDYELADDSRESLIWTKEQLVAPLQDGMEAPPHPMRLGQDEEDYYRLGPTFAAAESTGDVLGDLVRNAGEQAHGSTASGSGDE
jgi:NADH-quinone oxidoreductase subunit I